MDTLHPADAKTLAVEQRVHDLETCVERLSERVSALEESVRTGHAPRSKSIESFRADTLSAPPPFPMPSTALEGSLLQTGWIPLAGRAFVVLAGAFLLRALTDSGRLPAAPGVWIGLTYALVWLVLADRRGGRSGLVHGTTALIIAMPLLAEAAMRFHVLAAPASAVVLAGVTFIALGVAWRQRLVLLSFAALLGAAATTLVVAVALGVFLAPTLAMVAISIICLWIAGDRRWAALAWLSAGAADVAVLLLTVRASVVPPLEAAAPALLAHALLAIGFVGTFLWRTRGPDPNGRRPAQEARAFEMAQTVAALGIAVADATAIARIQGFDLRWISVPALVSGAALYLQAFAFVLGPRGAGRQFYYVGMTAFGLALTGLILLVGPPIQPIVLAMAAVAITGLASWRSQPLLALHGSLAGVAAAISGGLIPLVAHVWLVRLAEWTRPDLILGLVLVATALALLIPRSLRHEQPSALAVMARLALATTLVAGLSTVLVLVIGPWLGGPTPEPGVVATLKSVILVMATLAVAYASRAPRFGELRWLTYALLGLGGMKILFEDFPVSSPSTLFVALAAYGAALIVVPKVVKKI